MKIALADEANLKFCKDLKEHWESLGHEVRFEYGASPNLAQWADIYYVEWCTNNVHYLYDLYHDDPRQARTTNWDNNKKPLIVCRAIDWDVWIGFVRNQELIDWVDKWICIAPHIEKKLRSEADFKDHLKVIQPGVNLKKFTLKQKQTDGFQIGMVLGNMWWYKNHMGGLDIFTTLFQKDPKWRLHIRGQHEAGDYNPVMFDHFLESRKIKEAVILHPVQDDMNLWYENIDYLLHPGMKEAFSYATAEAMAKGIRPVVNEFYGAKDIWPDNMLYQTHKQALKMFNKQGDSPEQIRKYIEDNYSLEKQIKETDQWIF